MLGFKVANTRRGERVWSKRGEEKRRRRGGMLLDYYILKQCRPIK